MKHAQLDAQARIECQDHHYHPCDDPMWARVGGIGWGRQVPAKVAEGNPGEDELEDQTDEVRAKVGSGNVLGWGEVNKLGTGRMWGGLGTVGWICRKGGLPAGRSLLRCTGVGGRNQ